MKNKAPKSFKIEMLERTILPALHWKGTKMIFAYNWNGYRKYARITAKKLFDAIEWDKINP